MSTPLESAHAAARQLLDDVQRIAATLAPAARPSNPIRVDRDQDVSVYVWVQSYALEVRSTADDGGGVFLSAGDAVPYRSGSPTQWAPDWFSITASEARTLGLALLSAAEHAESAGDVGRGVRGA